MRHSSLLIALTVCLAACSKPDASTASGSAKGGTFVFAASGEASDLLPPFVNESNGHVVQDLVFEPLAEIGPDLNSIGDAGFTPRLAKSWTWAPDSMSIVFHLDPAARWQDGKPVTASDVRYSFRVFTDPKTGSPTAGVVTNVDSVAVRDSLTAVVYYKRRSPQQFYEFCYQIFIMPEHVYGAVPDEQLKTSPVAKTIIGSGQYRLAKWAPGVGITLVADTANYRGRPNFDRVILTPTNPAAATAQLLGGQADFMENVPLDVLGKFDSSSVARAVQAPALSYAYLVMNMNTRKSSTTPNPIFADVRVRRAFSMGVDRAGMLANVFNGRGRLSHGPFSMTQSFADSSLHPLPYDTTAAKALLDSAGWRAGANGVRMKNGQPLHFSMLVPTSSEPRMRYAVLLQAQLQKLGAQVDLDQVDTRTFIARAIATNDFDAALSAFTPDPDIGGTRQVWGTKGGQNAGHYSNKKVDALIDSASRTFDPAKARAVASQAFQQIINDAPAVFLYDYLLYDGVNRRINITRIRPDGWSWDFADWSVPPDKRIDRDKIGVSAGNGDTAKKP